MVIDPRESEIFKRKMAQASHGIVGRELPAPHVVE
jgi:hypothetical protein